MMLGWLQDMVGLPVMGGLLLIVIAAVWYRFGSKAAHLATIIGLALIARSAIRKNAVNEERLKDHEADRKALDKANSDRLRTRDDARRGKLHDDDGFKRP